MSVTTVGRITPAKSPGFFAEAARRSRARGLDIEWIWVGGAGTAATDLAAAAELRDAGVRVTGWLPRAEALRHLEATDVCVHCASWEGAPLTILEAAAAGIPVIARRAPALEALGVAPLYETVDQLLEILVQYPHGRAFAIALESISGLRDRHTSERQREMLSLVYAQAARGRSPRRDRVSRSRRRASMPRSG